MVMTRSASRAETLSDEKHVEDVPLNAEDEEVTPALAKTRSYWICLIFPVGFVWAVPFIFCSMSLQHVWRYGQLSALPHHNWFYRFVLWCGHLEVPFQIWFQYLCHKAQAHKTYPPNSHEFLANMILQCMSVGMPMPMAENGRRPKQIEEPDWSQVPDATLHALRRRLRVWFLNAPMSAIHERNVAEWLAWAIGNGQTLENAERDPKTVALIQEGLGIVQKRLRWHFPPGFNPDVKTMRLTLDPVRLSIRPLGYYCVTNLAMGLPTYIWLITRHGFRIESRHGLQLLVKPPSDGPSPISHPIVLLHALGVGIAHNRAFLKHVAQSRRGVVLLLQPNISTHIWHPRFLDPPSLEEHVAAVKETCDAYHIKKATIISQSNGTMVHGWMLRNEKELCHRNILVDAVSFKLFEGDLCYAFLHKRRHTGFHLVLNYFVLRELGISHSISRDFQWTDMSLWEHELPSADPDRLRIVLGENDSLIDTWSIVEYLRECGVPDKSIRVIPKGEHGISLIMESEGMDEVLAMLR